MNTNRITRILFAAALLCGLAILTSNSNARADDDSWKPHPTAVKLKVEDVGEDDFGRNIATINGKKYVLVADGAKGFCEKCKGKTFIFVPETGVETGDPYLRGFKDDWKTTKTSVGLYKQLKK